MNTVIYLGNFLMALSHIICFIIYIMLQSKRLSNRKYAVMLGITSLISIAGAILIKNYGSLCGQLLWCVAHIDVIFFNCKYMNKVINRFNKNGKEKDFLTLDEVKAQGLYYHVYTEDESVYKYYIEGKGETLVENKVKLCENMCLCWWEEKGVYKYYIEGKGYTLVENGVKLCENVYLCYWLSRGVYQYKQTRDSYVVKIGF